VRSLIADAGAAGLTSTELTRKTQGMRKRDRDDHVRTLVESGQVVERLIDTGGRPGKIYMSTMLPK